MSEAYWFMCPKCGVLIKVDKLQDQKKIICPGCQWQGYREQEVEKL